MPHAAQESSMDPLRLEMFIIKQTRNPEAVGSNDMNLIKFNA